MSTYCEDIDVFIIKFINQPVFLRDAGPKLDIYVLLVIQTIPDLKDFCGMPLDFA
jgi:hypothetical protein